MLIIVSLASVLLSRLMFNLREERQHPVATATTTATDSDPTSAAILLHTLTNVEDNYESVICEPPYYREGLFSDTT